jgi:murein DD-endopeptidase MepM/ murein hydrolase activator NlpD
MPVAERRYIFPVQSDGEISYGKFHHDYPAADIFCPVGSIFVAPTDGVVDFVSRADEWDPQVDDGATRGGLSVAIVGDDGVRYYGSHLSQVADGIEPGVRVTAGQQLGLTGKTGSARDTPPHLHFGLSRPTSPEDWQVRRGEVAPYIYLKAWERGENVTPDLE